MTCVCVSVCVGGKGMSAYFRLEPYYMYSYICCNGQMGDELQIIANAPNIYNSYCKSGKGLVMNILDI